MTTIHFKGAPIQTNGQLPVVGSNMPAFTLTRSDLTEFSSEECRGKFVILNIFPSLDTPTCSMTVKKFNESAHAYTNTLILCVSLDLPFAQKRFCNAENLTRVMPLSAFRHPNFGQDFGVMIQDGPLAGLFSRAIIVCDAKSRVLYTEQVADIANEPNYDAALQSLQKAVVIN